MSKRIVFTFDDRAFEALEKLMHDGKFRSYADTVRHALQLSKAISEEAANGYTKLVLRNPATKDELSLRLVAP